METKKIYADKSAGKPKCLTKSGTSKKCASKSGTKRCGSKKAENKACEEKSIKRLFPSIINKDHNIEK